MKDLLLYIAQSGFLSEVIKIAIAGVVAGFGFSIILSIIGYSAYKIFNLIERSSY